jgi:hypothetical protein
VGKLERDKRGEVVKFLADQGMSTRHRLWRAELVNRACRVGFKALYQTTPSLSKVPMPFNSR